MTGLAPATPREAEVHLINGGHFLLESHLDVVAGYLRGFLGRVLEQELAQTGR